MAQENMRKRYLMQMEVERNMGQISPFVVILLRLAVWLIPLNSEVALSVLRNLSKTWCSLPFFVPPNIGVDLQDKWLLMFKGKTEYYTYHHFVVNLLYPSIQYQQLIHYYNFPFINYNKWITWYFYVLAIINRLLVVISSSCWAMPSVES